MNQDDYYWDNFDLFKINQALFSEAAGEFMLIGLFLKANHHKQFLLAKIHETLCRFRANILSTKNYQAKL